jgi:hypothetical protein
MSGAGDSLRLPEGDMSNWGPVPLTVRVIVGYVITVDQTDASRGAPDGTRPAPWIQLMVKGCAPGERLSGVTISMS